MIERNIITSAGIRLSDIDQLSIAHHYFNVTKLPHKLNSPIREDKNPSCALYMKKGAILFHDFSTGETMGLIKLVAKYLGIDDKDTESIRDRILTDMGKPSEWKRLTRVVRTELKYVITTEEREFEDCDVVYWMSYGIDIATLISSGVRAISSITYQYPNKKITYSTDKCAYAFHEFKDGNETLKIYQPLVKDKKWKWRSTHPGDVIQLWTTLPKEGDIVMICSSLKDALCVRCNMGIPSIAPQSETVKPVMMSPSAVKSLKNRFHRIVVCFDTDQAGRKGEAAMCEMTGFEQFNLDEFEGGKDISDFYKVFGKQRFIEMINNKLNRNE